MERCNISKKKYFRCFEVSTCPPGQVRTCPNQDFSGPDMTKSGLLVKFCMFWVQNWVFDEIYK